MIPLRDNIPSRRLPVVTFALIGLNVLVFLFEFFIGPARLEKLIWIFGLVPARLFHGGDLIAWLTPLTSMFLHGGWWHLISNMLALYIFGDNVEDRMGHTGYLLFYVASGLAAGALQVVINLNSLVPMVGASGAIAGVLGAYLVMFPTARVFTLVPLFYFIRLVEIPALIYLGFWFVSQLFNGLFALGVTTMMQAGGVAWWAHIGGFVFGLAIAKIIPSPPPPPPRPPPTIYFERDRPPWWNDRF